MDRVTQKLTMDRSRPPAWEPVGLTATARIEPRYGSPFVCAAGRHGLALNTPLASVHGPIPSTWPRSQTQLRTLSPARTTAGLRSAPRFQHVGSMAGWTKPSPCGVCSSAVRYVFPRGWRSVVCARSVRGLCQYAADVIAG